MSEPVATPAWHPDPRGEAQLRWHDGTGWTDHVHGDAPAPSTAAPHLVSASAPGGPQPVCAPPSTSGKAIAALVTALVGIPIVPLVLGILALRQIGRSAGRLTGGWMAIVGIVLSALQLLVIPILLAVAIPTFLAQKDAAARTFPAQDGTSRPAATANVKLGVNVVESCAVQRTDGSYRGCDAAGVAAIEPGVKHLLAKCGTAGGICIRLHPDMLGYEVSTVDLGTPPTTYREIHDADGTLTKACAGPACPTGRWD